MTRLIALAIGLAVAAAMAFLLGARSQASPPEVSGTIIIVDASEQRIRITHDQEEHWFQCTNHTKITLNGYAATFSQLAAGQTAKIVYEPTQFEAIQVDAMPASTPKPQ